MGMFDYLHCKLPQVNKPDMRFQTKCTPSQYLELYEIREDGTLWHQNCESMEWSRLEDYRGEIVFYEETEDEWFEYSAIFIGGKVIDLKRIDGT